MAHGVELTEAEQELLEDLWQHQMEGRPVTEGLHEDLAAHAFVEKGWVLAGDTKLTEAGQLLARRAIRRHRLAERLLTDLMGPARERAEEDACVLEHSLIEGLDERVCTFLGHPTVCPHGHPIPEGECCAKAGRTVDPVVLSLARLKPGEGGTIAYLSAHESGDLQKFLAMGVHPGDDIAVVRQTPSIVFRCGHSQFAIDRHMAEQVYVRRDS
jgi:DtxR family transcriptional regulator, Mn-dependent transcriptional regulator